MGNKPLKDAHSVGGITLRFHPDAQGAKHYVLTIVEHGTTRVLSLTRYTLKRYASAQMHIHTVSKYPPDRKRALNVLRCIREVQPEVLTDDIRQLLERAGKSVLNA